MPWPTQTPMSQRLEFIHAVLHRAPGESIIDICRQIGISEKTGHKWLTRFGDAQTNSIGRHSLATPPVGDEACRDYSSVCWSSSSGYQRKVGFRAAAVSSKRRRGVRRGAP